MRRCVWLDAELVVKIDCARTRSGDSRRDYIVGAILDALDADGVLVPDDVIARELAFIHGPAGGKRRGEHTPREHTPRDERWPAAPAGVQTVIDRSRLPTRASTSTSSLIPPQTPPVAS